MNHGCWKAVLRLLLVAVHARPAVVAFSQGSTCLRQEIALQTCRLTLQICPSSIGCVLAEIAIRLAIHVQSSLLLLVSQKPFWWFVQRSSDAQNGRRSAYSSIPVPQP